MEPTHVEISRACEQVLRDVYEASNRTPGAAVACDGIRRRVPMTDDLWKRVSADLRHTGMVWHDGDESTMKLTGAGAAQGCLGNIDGARMSSTAA